MLPVSELFPVSFSFMETPLAISGPRKLVNTKETPSFAKQKLPRKLSKSLKIPSTFPGRFPDPDTSAVPLVPEYAIPRLVGYGYGHSCEKGFSPCRRDPVSVLESGSMPLDVWSFPQQLPALSSRLFFDIGIQNN